MDKIKLNYWIDVAMFFSFLVCSLTGLFKFPALVRFFGLAHKNFPMKLISGFHDWSGLILLILVLFHVILHWKWMTCMTKKFFTKNKKCE